MKTKVCRNEILPMVRDILFWSPMEEQLRFDHMPSSFREEVLVLELLESARKCNPKF